ncbi:DUF4023 domain-containing protein [Paenibacillus sp. BSR1-1]|nr:DUF4023 domain-containing protein [Paenibacillus sp. BSR1-1]MDN3017781.1 DUF4023 domain-containing protein [Paenibacillus sp. BSR1-1]
MDNNKSTHEFVEDLRERQEKDRKNKEHQGDNRPAKKLPNHSH